MAFIPKFNRTAGAVVLATGVIFGGALLYNSSNYTDLPGFGEDHQEGRTRNSVANIVTGIVGQKMYGGHSTIDVGVERSFFPDTRVTGSTTPESIDTAMDLTFTDNKFNASAKNGLLEGKLDKSDFDWSVKQTGADTFEVGRFGFKLDTTLTLHVADGRINGSYSHPLKFNWAINGTYDTNAGAVKVNIDVPWSSSDVVLDGKITR